MSREPTEPKSATELPATQKAASGKTGSLPEAKSASEDIAAFVARARAMSPHAPGARGRLVFALDAIVTQAGNGYNLSVHSGAVTIRQRDNNP